MAERNRSFRVLPLSDLRINGETGRLETGDGEALGLTEHAARQLARKASVPAAWAISAPTDIVAETFNYFLPSQPGTVVLMLEGNDRVVGVNSDRVAPLPSEPLVERLPRVDGMSVVNWRLEATGLAVRMESARSQVQPKVGDLVSAGVDLLLREYSDEGLGLRAVLNRLICTNGAVMPEAQDSRRLLRKEAWRSVDARIELAMEQINDVTYAALAAAENLPRLPDLSLALPDEDEERDSLLRPGLKVLGVPGRFTTAVADAMHGEDPTMFGLYNAVTRLGRDAAAAKERELFERAGYRTLVRLEPLRAAIGEAAGEMGLSLN